MDLPKTIENSSSFINQTNLWRCDNLQPRAPTIPGRNWTWPSRDRAPTMGWWYVSCFNAMYVGDNSKWNAFAFTKFVTTTRIDRVWQTQSKNNLQFEQKWVVQNPGKSDADHVAYHIKESNEGTNQPRISNPWYLGICWRASGATFPLRTSLFTMQLPNIFRSHLVTPGKKIQT